MLTRIRRQLDVPLHNLAHERYWNDPRLMRVTCDTPLDVTPGHHAEAVYTTLQIAQRVAYHWEVDPIQSHETGVRQWGGSHAHALNGQPVRFAVPGIHVMLFELRSDVGFDMTVINHR